jgi:tetratricopeptide (TPR) repeat protein
MIDRLLGDSVLSDEAKERVMVAAEGNPLYIEQMVSMVKEHGGGEIVVPPTINALLAARLDNLTREERAVVEPASVIGLVFAEAAVAAMVPSPLMPTVPGHLTDLDRKQFVHPLPADEDPLFRFHHILVRDAAYQSLLKRARATLHERFVDWAEPVNRERGRETEFEEILGYHLEQAVRYRSELGPLDALGQSIGRRASTKLSSAGRRAFARGDGPAACNLLRRAAGLLPTDDPDRVELLAELADALSEEGHFDESQQVLDEAAAIAERLRDERLKATIAVEYRALHIMLSQLEGSDQAIAELHEAIRVFEAAEDTAGLARAWRWVMVIEGTRGAYDVAAEAATKVVVYARMAGEPRHAARGAMGYSATALNGPTRVDEAITTCRKLIEDVRGDRKAESIISVVIAQLEAMSGNFDEARELCVRAAATLAEFGPSVTSSSLSIEMSRVDALAGDFEAAEQALRRDDEALEAMGERLYRSTVDALLAQVLVTLDRVDEAVTISERAEELSDPDDVDSQVFWRTARARAFARLGKFEDGEVLAREAVELARATVSLTLLGGALTDLAEVLTASGRRNEAGPPLREALDLFERKGDLTSSKRVRGLLEAAAPV